MLADSFTLIRNGSQIKVCKKFPDTKKNVHDDEKRNLPAMYFNLYILCLQDLHQCGPSNPSHGLSFFH